ncbi:MAG: hypothetical protein AAGC97_07970 [Planctomycetota bacterium]
MTTIRTFGNADLPGLFEVWIRHWEAARYQVHLSVTALERAILSRTFFRPEHLLIAESDGNVVAWCHWFPNLAPVVTGETPSEQDRSATIASFCFAGDHGLAVCDDLLTHVERICEEAGASEMRFGIVRDDQFGYAGIDPVGHGIGVPTADARTSSMLSRHGYRVAAGLERLVASTSTYRVRTSREFLQLRRQTRVDQSLIMPTELPRAIALSHFDLERHQLVNHVRREVLAEVDFWLSDTDGPVMDGHRAILSLPTTPLSPEERFLISAVIPTLAIRNVYSVETAIDDQSNSLVDQMKDLAFKSVETGRQWIKSLV